jgi:hypothetical protein
VTPALRSSICLFVAAFAIAGASAAATPLEKEIADLYRRGLQGDKAAVEQCIAKLEATLQTQPANELARVYLGSAYTLRSRDLGFGPKKLQVLRQGVAVMDEAVAAAPGDPKVRLARALTTSALPTILGYRGASRKDFDLLAATAEREPAKFDEGDLQIIFYNAGNAAKENGDRARATALWQLAARHPADPTLTEKVNAAVR